MSLLNVKDLNISLGKHKLLNDISFTLKENSILGVTGKSGAGKSMLAKAILKLLAEDKFKYEGELLYGDINILGLSNKGLRKIRGAEIGYISQNPMTSFNPLIKIGKQMVETLRSHSKVTRKEAKDMVLNALLELNLKQHHRVYNSYPYQLSGGMLQRVAIANIMLLDPKILIADEPTTALDADTKGIIINMLEHIRKNKKMSMIYITHDYDVLEQLSDSIMVLGNGRILEYDSKKALLYGSRSSLTKRLIGTTLSNNRERKVISL